ncbi:hypothetical protein J3R82DRAFT_5174 [Butyriboletus roseoflavus]|nr:hypothetical protein J3R82DRAFT_5174 [Butyriboletus roseoflavus]
MSRVADCFYFIGHFNSFRKDILHCDVSNGNVLYKVEGTAPEHVVPDWPKDEGQYPKHAGMLGD